MSLVPAQAVEVGMEEDVKPDISGDLEPSAAADGGEEDEERERNIKDYKPDISLSYKGKSARYPGPGLVIRQYSDQIPRGNFS